VFSVGGDQALRMWDAQNGRELSEPTQFPLYCYALGLIPGRDAVLVGSGPSVNLWDLSRSEGQLAWAPRLEAARPALDLKRERCRGARDSGRMVRVPRVHDWAIDMLSQARANGADVSPLTLARCYWQMDRTSDAATEFRNALTRKEAPAEYLNLCLDAVMMPRAAAPTMPNRHLDLRASEECGGQSP